MKLIIFAGGVGTRLWPLSRENSPKQFDKFFNGQSTLQLAIARVAPEFGIENIYIQTIEKYKSVIKEQIPGLPDENFFIEPERRNLAPAVCLSAIKFSEMEYDGPIAILWADHLMKRENEFINGLQAGKELIKINPERFVFLGEKPRFANNNLGWINVGERLGEINGKDFYGFNGWKYRPETELCQKMFASGNYFWNPGYFITSVKFLLDCYKNLAPDIYENVSSGNYKQAPKIDFDSAIIEKVNLSNAIVVKTDMGWSDPGTLYAMKEALEFSHEENVVIGQVTELNSSDCLFYNTEEGKLIAGVGLKGMVVVNTPEALIVVPKEEVVNVTSLIKKIKEEGLDKYL